VVVTATGLNLLFLGGVEMAVDGQAVDVPKTMTYKGMMLSGVPNCAFTVGYTNASWTLKADLTSEYVCRLLAYMDAHGYAQSVPEITDPSVTEEPLLDFTSGYVLRSLDRFPKQGSKEPWKLRQNYVFDLRSIRHAPLDDGAMQFSRRVAARPLDKVAG
jgi:cation diffusion facilitator CzcD-associated flavoprotein CzcO